MDFRSKAHRIAGYLISTYLTEKSIFRPINITIVAESPDLGVNLSSCNRMHIPKVFLNKTALELGHLFCRFALVQGSFFHYRVN
jgi:hypothetical protein